MEKETKERLFNGEKFQSLSESAREKTLKFISEVEDIKSLSDKSWYGIFEAIDTLSNPELKIDRNMLKMFCDVCFLHAKDLYGQKVRKPRKAFREKALMIMSLIYKIAESAQSND